MCVRQTLIKGILRGKLRASDGIGREPLELAQAHRGAKVPCNGWEGGTYNNDNDNNVLMLCTMCCEAEGIQHPPGYGGLASARCLGTAGNHRDIASTNQQLSQLCCTNITTTISGINVQGDDALSTYAASFLLKHFASSLAHAAVPQRTMPCIPTGRQRKYAWYTQRMYNVNTVKRGCVDHLSTTVTRPETPTPVIFSSLRR